MRLLALVPYKVLPADSGGRSVSAGVFQHYAAQAEHFAALALATLREPRFRGQAPFAYSEHRTAASSLIALERAGLTKVPYLWALRAYGPRLARVALRARADVVEVTMPWLMRVRRHLPSRVKVVLVMQNVEAIWYEDEIQRSCRPMLWARRLERIEREAVTLADHVVTFTEQDRAELGRRYGVPPRKMTALPPGCDDACLASAHAAPRASRAGSNGRTRAVFVGSRFSGNLAAALSLVKTVAPACAAYAEVWIAGTVCSQLAGQRLPANVRLLGYVEDLSAVLDACDVFVNPSTMRTGINVKVIEALGHGLRVVSTPEGARGYEPLIGGAIVTAAVHDFAAHLRSAAPLSAGEQAQIAPYAWSCIAARRLKLYRALAADSRLLT